MTSIMTQDTREQMSVFPEQAFPAAPFPRKYIHCMFDTLQDALQAAQAVRDAGRGTEDVYVMAGEQFVEAVEQRQTLLNFLTSVEIDGYLLEASQGRAILSMRPAGYEQMTRIASLLAAYHAHHIRYIDTWTVTELYA